MMRKIIAVLMATIAAGSIAYVVAYAGSSNTNYTSAGTVGFRTTTDGTTNCVGTTACNLANITIWDSVAGANGLNITTNSAMKIEGAGGANTPVGGVVSVQGVSNGFPLVGNITQFGGSNMQTGVGASGVGIPRVTVANDSAVTVNPATPANWGISATAVAPPANGLMVTCSVTTAAPTYTTGQVDPFSCDTSGNLRTTASLTWNNTNKVEIWDGTTTTAVDSGTSGLKVFVANANANGSNTAANSSPTVNPQTTPIILNGMTNTAKTIKASAGQLVMIQCYNPNAAVTYAQIYNNAAPTIGTGVILSFGIAPTSTGGFALPGGIQFGTAITAAATTTATGSTAPATAMDCNASYM